MQHLVSKGKSSSFGTAFMHLSSRHTPGKAGLVVPEGLSPALDLGVVFLLFERKRDGLDPSFPVTGPQTRSSCESCQQSKVK